MRRNEGRGRRGEHLHARQGVHLRFVSSPSATTEPASAPKTALVRSEVACRTEPKTALERSSELIRGNQSSSEVGGYLPDGAVHEAARDDCRVGRGDEGPPCVNRQGVKRLSRRHRRQSEV